MKLNSTKRGLLLVLITLCMAIVGFPVAADETTWSHSGPDTVFPVINPDLSSGLPAQVTLFTLQPGEVVGLISNQVPLKGSKFSSNSTEFLPIHVSDKKPVSQWYATLREKYLANPIPVIAPNTAPIHCRF